MKELVTIMSLAILSLALYQRVEDGAAHWLVLVLAIYSMFHIFVTLSYYVQDRGKRRYRLRRQDK